MPTKTKKRSSVKPAPPIVTIYADAWQTYPIGQPREFVRDTYYGGIYLRDQQGQYLYSRVVHLFREGPRGGHGSLCGKRVRYGRCIKRVLLNRDLQDRMCSTCMRAALYAPSN